MKFVLTGASGFIGSHLLKHLQANGHDTAMIGRGFTQDEMVHTLKTSQPDVVIHLASCFIAEHKPSDIENIMNSNVLFGSQLLEAMRITGCKKIINTGTTWQHFQKDRNQPVCLYSASKNAFEEILKYYISAEDFKVITLKICDSYGSDDKRGKLISKMIDSLKTGQKFELSPGEQKIDLVHIEDIVDAFLATVNILSSTQAANLNKAYTLASDKPISIRELVAKIEDLSKAKLNITFGARPYRKREVMVPEILDPILPNWNASISLEHGLKELIHGL